MIVPVAKVRIIASASEQDLLLETLQKQNKFMFFNNELETTLNSEDQNKLKNIEKNIALLEKYTKKKFFAYHEIDEASFKEIAATAEGVLERVNREAHLIEVLTNKNEELTRQINLVGPYQTLPVATVDITELQRTRIELGYVSSENAKGFIEQTEKSGFAFEISKVTPEQTYGAFIYDLVNENEAHKIKNVFKFTTEPLPIFDEKLSKLVPYFEEEIATNIDAIGFAKETLKNLSSDVLTLKVYYDYLFNESIRRTVKVASTSKTIYIEGWVREDELTEFTKQMQNTLSCDVEKLFVGDNEFVPTATKNNWFVRQFETITNMFSVPNPKEFDPNPIMSIWYWVIFGIMMGDIGYGIAMILVFSLFVKLKKPKGELKKLVLVFAFSGVTSIIFGILTGSFFGADVDLLQIIGNWFGNPNLTSVVLQPVNDPLPMLIFSLALGVLHILTGLIIKAVTEIKRKNILGALSDAISWIFVLVGISLFILVPIQWIGLSFIGVGVILILTLTGRKSKGVFGKVIGGLGGLYSSTNYLSDVLSYSRILALSLSTAVIAFTMNLLAGMVSGSVIGFVFAILIYIVGHLFNFVMGLLSAYVHDGRLQYLEYFGKFYEGGGYAFTPFTYELKYINEIKKEIK